MSPVALPPGFERSLGFLILAILLLENVQVALEAIYYSPEGWYNAAIQELLRYFDLVRSN